MQVQTGDCGWRAKYKNQVCKVVSISMKGRFSEENKGLCVTFVNPLSQLMMMSPTLTLALWKAIAVVASSLRVTSKETKYGVETISCEEPKKLRKAIPEKIQS